MKKRRKREKKCIYGPKMKTKKKMPTLVSKVAALEAKEP